MDASTSSAPTHYAIPIQNWEALMLVLGVMPEGVRMALAPHLPGPMLKAVSLQPEPTKEA